MVSLNIAEICPSTRTLGPGLRCAIWVQGCCFSCSGCVSPDWIPQTTATLIDSLPLANYILSLQGIEGITISGGEPMLQAMGLVPLISHLRQHSNLSIICYSGFTLSQLQAKSDPAISQLLSLLDVLIDGLYVEKLNDNQGWRGSSNQVVHFLTPRYLSQSHLFTQRRRDVEVHLRSGDALLVGVPPRQFPPQFHEAIASASGSSNYTYI